MILSCSIALLEMEVCLACCDGLFFKLDCPCFTVRAYFAFFRLYFGFQTGGIMHDVFKEDIFQTVSQEKMFFPLFLWPLHIGKLLTSLWNF